MKTLFQKPQYAVIIVALFALCLATLFQIVLPTSLRGTPGGEWEAIWQPTARSFMAGEGFRSADGEVLTTFPPGFPIALAGAFAIGDAFGLSTTTSALILNTLSYVVMVIAIYWTAYLLWKTWQAALLAALLSTTYPFLLWVLRVPSTEAPYMALFYSAWLLLWWSIIKNSRSLIPYFICGLLLGASILIRPAGVLTGFLAAITIVLTLWQSQQWRSLILAGMLVLGNVLAILPWEISLYNNTQRFILLGTVSNRNILGGLSFSIGDTEDERTIPVPKVIFDFQKHLDERANEITGYGSYMRVMLDEFIQDPVTVTLYFLIKAARSWYGSDTGSMDNIGLLLQIPYLLVIIAAAFIALRSGGQARFYVLSTSLFILYFWLLAITSYPLLRYLVPMFGMLFIFVPAYLVFYTEFRARNSLNSVA